MGKFKFIVAAIVIVGLASLIAWQHASNESLRRDNDALKQTLADLKQLPEAPATATTEDALTDEQRAELLKLRAEVTGLREQTNQIGALADANQKLQTSLKEARASRANAGSGGGSDAKKKKPEDALPQDIHPKDSWAFRGYATPEATIESTCWGMLNGDKATILAAFSPDMLPEMEKQLEGKDLKEELGKVNMAEFRILDRRQLSDDEMMLTIYTSRQDDNGNTTGNSENTVFQRIGGQWKVTKKPPPQD
jgi:hypothetical protein